jgi:hypothetical protein
MTEEHMPVSLEPALARMREAGWVVAVHNDYKLHGEPHTFWGFTRGVLFVKGEGPTDSEALDEAYAAASNFPADLDVKALLRQMRALHEIVERLAPHQTSIDSRDFDAIRAIVLNGVVPPEPSPQHHVRVLLISDAYARLMVNGYGVCTWDQQTMITDEATGLEYAYVVAQALRRALAHPDQAAWPRTIFEKRTSPKLSPRTKDVWKHCEGGDCHYAETRVCECICDGCSTVADADTTALTEVRVAWQKERAEVAETARILQEQLTQHRLEVERLHHLEEAAEAFVEGCDEVCGICRQPTAECDKGYAKKDACPGCLLRLYMLDDVSEGAGTP